MASTLLDLGRIAEENLRYDEAKDAYGRAAALWQRLNDRPDWARALERQGRVAVALNEMSEAKGFYQQALRVVQDQPTQVLPIFYALAEWHIAQKEPLQAMSLLAFLTHAPETPDDLQDTAESLLLRLEDDLSPAEAEQGWATGKTATLEMLLKTWL
jgi:tetratricopeptide (TPR) repeat protein